MDDKTVSLYLQNYNNEGSVADLPKYVKTKEITFKKQNITKAIKYYHWFIIEMFFRLQGGTHKVVDYVKRIDSTSNSTTIDNETGEFIDTETSKTALFVEIELEWHGEKLTELYPIFDSSNSKVILLPDAQDINNSYKRGLVRGIARISGIGGDRFGDYDDQFGDESGSAITFDVKDASKKDDTHNKETKKVETKVEKKTEPKVSKTKVETKKVETKVEKDIDEENDEIQVGLEKQKLEEVIVVEDEDEEEVDFVSEFLNGSEIKTKEEKKVTKKVDEIKETKNVIKASKEEYGEDTEEYADLLLYVKREQKKKNLAKEMKAFIIEKGKELFSELSYSELLEAKEVFKL